MASLYAGTDLETGRRIAVRVFEAVPVQDIDVHGRAQALRDLKGPGIAALYAAVRTADDAPALVESALTGEALLDRLARQPLALREALQVLDALLEALAACHAQGVLHRDLRPEMVYITGAGQQLGVMLRGAGHASLFSDQATPTLGGTAYGNPLFTAPEQWVNRAVDASTDLYSLAGLGYLLLTGRTFIEPGLPFEICRRHFTAERPVPAATVVGEPVPAAVGEVLRRAAAAERPSRYGSADAMRAALAEAREHLDADAPVRFEAVGVEVDDVSFNFDLSILEEIPIEAGISEHMIEDMTGEFPSPVALGLMPNTMGDRPTFLEQPVAPASTVEMSIPQFEAGELAEIEAMPDDTLADHDD